MPVNVGGNIINSSSITSNGAALKTIITNGLIGYYDAANVNSYSGSGTTWTDLSSKGNNLTIYGSPAWTTVGGAKAFNLTADGHYMQGNGMVGFPTLQVTLEAWIYPGAGEITSGDRGTIILARDGSACYMSLTKDTVKQSNYWYGHNPEGYHEVTPSVSRQSWHHFGAIWDNANFHQWVDGKYYGKVFNVTGTSPSNSTWQIGRESSGRQFSGAISAVRIYDRALAGAEIIQNFNADKSRFGL